MNHCSLCDAQWFLDCQMTTAVLIRIYHYLLRIVPHILIVSHVNKLTPNDIFLLHCNPGTNATREHQNFRTRHMF